MGSEGGASALSSSLRHRNETSYWIQGSCVLSLLECGFSFPSNFFSHTQKEGLRFCPQSVPSPWSKEASRMRGDPGPDFREQQVYLGISHSDLLIGAGGTVELKS